MTEIVHDVNFGNHALHTFASNQVRYILACRLKLNHHINASLSETIRKCNHVKKKHPQSAYEPSPPTQS